MGCLYDNCIEFLAYAVLQKYIIFAQLYNKNVLEYIELFCGLMVLDFEGMLQTKISTRNFSPPKNCVSLPHAFFWRGKVLKFLSRETNKKIYFVNYTYSKMFDADITKSEKMGCNNVLIMREAKSKLQQVKFLASLTSKNICSPHKG